MSAEEPEGGEQELDYIEGSGPGVAELPAGMAEPPPGRDGQEVVPPGWTEEQIGQFMRGTGAGIHWMAGVAEDDWRFTEEDLERITGPLTRMANRYEPALRLSGYADPALVAHGLWLWAWRSAIERTRALRAAEAAGDGYERTPSEPAAGAGAATLGDYLAEEEADGPLDTVASDADQAATVPNMSGAGAYFPQSPLADDEEEL